MFSCFVRDHRHLARFDGAEIDGPLPWETVWIDIVDPTPQEVGRIEALCGIEIPSAAQLQEIETSSRLYVTAEAMFMTVTALSRDPRVPRLFPVTLILVGERLVTFRDTDALAFPIVARKAVRAQSEPVTNHDIFFGLLDAMVDRIADRLEQIGKEIDAVSADVFESDTRTRRSGTRVHGMIKRLGRHGSELLRVQDSLMSLERLGLFLSHMVELSDFGAQDQGRIRTFARDVKSLAEYADALDNKINFVLDAVLGLVDLDQNQIMKIISMMGAVFLPPTLISSIYGMNFQDMPALSWHYGFLVTVLLMVGTVAVAGILFRWRRWL